MIFKRYQLINLCVFTSIFLSVSAYATTVNTVLDAAGEKISSAQKVQKRINKIDDVTQKIRIQHEINNKRLEGVRVYNAQLELQIKDQETNMTKLDASIRQAATMEGDMAPLVEEMIAGLRQFIELDLPFDREERLEAVNRLEANQADSQISAAERFRQILETYRIESEYGRNIDSKSQTIPLNGTEMDVNVLRVGRIALMYQSNDQNSNGVWNKNTQSWESLPSQYKKSLATLYKMANKQASINMMNLPISSPQEAQ